MPGVSIRTGRAVELSGCSWCKKHRAPHPACICDSCVAVFKRALQSPRWNKHYRPRFLAANPFCVHCREVGRFVLATDVDHILAWRTRPDLFWVESNHQGLCHECHSVKTNRENIPSRSKS